MNPKSTIKRPARASKSLPDPQPDPELDEFDEVSIEPPDFDDEEEEVIAEGEGSIAG